MSNEKQVYEVFIRTTPERLWQGLTDPALTSRYFFKTSVRSSFRPGEPIVYAFPHGATAVDGEVLEVEPGRRLVHTWVTRYDEALARERSRVTWQIDRRGEACKLTATHELEHAPLTAKHVGTDGWSMILSALKTLLETGEELVVGAP